MLMSCVFGVVKIAWVAVTFFRDTSMFNSWNICYTFSLLNVIFFSVSIEEVSVFVPAHFEEVRHRGLSITFVVCFFQAEDWE